MTGIFPDQHLDNAETNHLIIPWILISLHPDKEAGKGNPESHDTPVQPEEARVVMAPFSLRLGSQMAEKGNR